MFLFFSLFSSLAIERHLAVEEKAARAANFGLASQLLNFNLVP